jgi:hypothetical protein
MTSACCQPQHLALLYRTSKTTAGSVGMLKSLLQGVGNHTRAEGGIAVARTRSRQRQALFNMLQASCCLPCLGRWSAAAQAVQKMVRGHALTGMHLHSTSPLVRGWGVGWGGGGVPLRQQLLAHSPGCILSIIEGDARVGSHACVCALDISQAGHGMWHILPQIKEADQVMGDDSILVRWTADTGYHLQYACEQEGKDWGIWSYTGTPKHPATGSTTVRLHHTHMHQVAGQVVR